MRQTKQTRDGRSRANKFPDSFRRRRSHVRAAHEWMNEKQLVDHLITLRPSEREIVLLASSSRTEKFPPQKVFSIAKLLLLHPAGSFEEVDQQKPSKIVKLQIGRVCEENQETSSVISTNYHSAT